MSPSRDDDLVRRAVRGERDALRGLLERYGPMVLGLCRALDPEPDDAYQEVWEKALRALPRFDPAGTASLSTWLYGVAHHHLVDRSRRGRVRRVEPLVREPAVHADPADGIARAEEAERLRVALLALPDAQRRAVVLHYVDGVGLAEVAAREGVPVGTVKSRLHLGRARLLALLGGRR